MSIISGVTVNWRVSPRIITIPSPLTEITIVDLQDTLLDIEDSDEGMIWPHLRNTSGGEDLGGGVSVGWTMELQNAQVAFAARTTNTSNGTVTTGDSIGTTLIDSGATFVTDGVLPGATVFNVTDQSVATVITVDSETQLTHEALADGTDNDWDSSDVYKVWNEVQCEVSGGNLVAVDGGGSSISPIFPTFGTQILKTSSSSATTQEQADIQYASFNGGVTLDEANGTSGTEFPAGTPRQPVDNFDDALTIANDRGFITIYLVGDAVVDGSNNFTDFTFVGQGQNLSLLTLQSASLFTNVSFFEAEVTGTLDGDTHIEDCVITDLVFVSGIIERCMINPGTITLGGNETAHFIDCFSGVPGVSTPTIDMGGSGQALAMRGYNGGIKLTNKTGSDQISIDLNSGQVRLDPNATTGVVDGTIVVRGVGKVVNDTTGETLPLGTSTFNSATIINETTDASLSSIVNTSKKASIFSLLNFIK